MSKCNECGGHFQKVSEAETQTSKEIVYECGDCYSTKVIYAPKNRNIKPEKPRVIDIFDLDIDVSEENTELNFD
jgi:DNA-directed RNA polymerase subunit RPC12/RpoP